MVVASYAAFNRGDLDALLELYTEDCAWDITRWPGADAVIPGRYEGHEGLAGVLEDFSTLTRPWGAALAEFEQVLDLGEGRFWVEGRIRFATPAGDAELFDRWIQLIRMRDRRIAEIVMYWDVDEARRDAGLDEVPRR